MHLLRIDFRTRHRRGATLVLAAILMFVLTAFLAFSIDTGYLAQTRAELRRTADAAALAAGWELYEQLAAGGTLSSAESAMRLAAYEMAQLNPVCASPMMLDNTGDIQIGYIDYPRESTINMDDTRPYYAVEVTARRTSNRNGQVPFFFGRIFGQSGRNMEVTAMAVLARQVSGFQLPEGSSATLNILPFALDEYTWDNMLACTMTGCASAPSDDFAWDPASQTVTPGGDGVYEVNLYPQGTGSPGNRGTVDIGGANNSTNDIARQIVHGISSQDLIDLGKPLILDPGGTMTLNGDTGISAGVKDELASIIGQTRIIPIFSTVTGNGNNAEYTIVRWVGVRIMYVKLTGPMSKKKVLVQPAYVLSPYAIRATAGGDWSDYVLTPVRLAK
ncbi:MAG: hypothetical protein KatS3mg111_0728 [Pirellulaceae bacterium]|nr:MAG: hypothetical protein KatS3mg111_0728 [Pirellulaceae bacterium]